jgi:CBS domain-containing protein
MATIEKHFTRELVSLDAMAPCSEAAGLMEKWKVGSVAVRMGGKTIGVVTERDLALRVVAGGTPGSLPVGEVMRRDLPRAPATATDKEVADVMREHGSRHLLVEQGGVVVGVISMRDVIRLMLEEREFLIGQLQVYIDGR